MSIGPSNTYSGAVLHQGLSYAVDGEWDGQHLGKATVQNVDGSKLYVFFTVEDKTLKGTVTDGIWSAPLEGEQSAKEDGTEGNFRLLLDGDIAGTLALSNAQSTTTLTLPDGSAMNQQGRVSVTEQWPVYQDLYSGKGGILGWMGYDKTNVTGACIWSQPRTLQMLKITGE